MPIAVPDVGVLTSPDYWADLCPSYGHHRSPIMMLVEQTTGARWQLLQEGFFQLPPLVDTAQLLSIIQTLRVAGWPPVFAFIYDPAWTIFSVLSPLIKRLLKADDYLLLPALWAWYLDPAKQEAGWGPHSDNPSAFLPNGEPSRISIWIPLTNVDPENGCMYLVPKSRAREDGAVAVQDAIALPAKAGSILGWDQGVLHWGGRAMTSASVPRVSIAAEFQRADWPEQEPGMLRPDELPDFDQRLKLVMRQIRRYQHFHSLSPELVQLAERWEQ